MVNVISVYFSVATNTQHKEILIYGNIKRAIFNLYPFHIAKAAVTPHFTPLSINAATLGCASFCFHTKRQISAFWREWFKNRSEIYRVLSVHACNYSQAHFPPHYSVHPFTLTTAPSQTAAIG